jgi:hypothetical protein
MSPALRDLFGVSKPIIAMVHLRALPGRPRHDREAGMRPITEAVARDLAALQNAGVDGLLFCNEADLPYQLSVGPEAAAGMAAVIGEVSREIRRPFGVDLVWDPVASLADLGAIAAYRTGIGAESVALFANITPEFASSLGPRTIPERARSAVFLGVDAVLISGPITGTPTGIAELRAAKAAVPAAPVLANTGVTAGTVAEILAVADGAIVGTTLKRDAVTWNPVDPGRAATFMAAARRARESAVVG